MMWMVSVHLLGLLIGMTGPFVSAGSGTRGGIVTYVQGSVVKQKLDDSKWSNVPENSAVVGGERIRTLIRSRAELSLAELDRIRMAPKTTIDVLKLYEETEELTRESKISLKEGDLWANVAAKPESVIFSIGTPLAAAAITGTTLRMTMNQDSSAELRVYSGEVALSRTLSRREPESRSLEPHEIEGPHEIPGPHEVSMEQWMLIVRPMHKVAINRRGEVVSSTSFSRGDPEEQNEWVQWNLVRDAEFD